MSTVSTHSTGAPGEIVIGGAYPRSCAETHDADSGSWNDMHLTLNVGAHAGMIIVANMGDRPVQVGSHFHFAEANPALNFDRAAAWGCRLDIPAGTSVRFEPGIERKVPLARLLGARRVPGLRGLAAGPLDIPGVPVSLSPLQQEIQPDSTDTEKRSAQSRGPVGRDST